MHRFLKFSAAAGLTFFASTTAGAQTDNPETNKQIVTYEQWVKDVRDADFFFWNRYVNRKSRDFSEFPQPDDWYQPSKIVEGSEAAPIPRKAEKNRTIDPKVWNEISEWSFARKTGALLVMRNGEIEYEGYGEGKQPGSLIAVRSFTKSLPAMLTGIAIGEGHIKSLDEPIANYLSEWKTDPRGKITIRQLLTGSSGLEWVRFDKDPYNKVVRLAEGSQVNKVALSYNKVLEPDVRWTINNADTQLAALVVSRATGKLFDEYLSEKLWRPLGAGTATLNLDANDGEVRAFCCMRARASDWMRVGQMLMDGGQWQGKQIVPESYLQEMFKPSKANPYFGMGIWVGWDDKNQPTKSPTGDFLMLPHSEPYKDDNIVYLVGGLSVFMWMIPDKDMVVLRWGDDPEDWDSSYIPNLLIEHLESKEPK